MPRTLLNLACKKMLEYSQDYIAVDEDSVGFLHILFSPYINLKLNLDIVCF